MTTLEPDQAPLRRIVKVYGVPGPVIAGIEHKGITLRVKGGRADIYITWADLAKACKTPGNVPSYLEGRGLEYLQHVATKQTEAATKKGARATTKMQ